MRLRSWQQGEAMNIFIDDAVMMIFISVSAQPRSESWRSASAPFSSLFSRTSGAQEEVSCRATVPDINGCEYSDLTLERHLSSAEAPVLHFWILQRG